MQTRKLNIFFAWFVYGGNGGIATSNPFLRPWFAKTLQWALKDERIGAVFDRSYCDTPITMSRNRAIVEAREAKADILVMIDSDNIPDHYMDSRLGSKPFFESSFEFLWKHYDRGPVVIGSPYCGPPSDELVYIFEWTNSESHAPDLNRLKLEMVGRADASRRTGIQEAGALPTGVTMWDIRAFELTEPKTRDDLSWFEYEWKDIYRSEKASTEDVYATREISLAGQLQLGYNPLFCNWDAWSAHVKQKIVGPPVVPKIDEICRTFRNAVVRNHKFDERVMMVGHDDPDWNPAEHPPMPMASQTYHMEDTMLHGHAFTRVGFASPRFHYEALTKLAAKRLGDSNAVMCEIGSWVGESAFALLAGAPNARIECVDTFTGNPKDDSSVIARYFGDQKIRDAFLNNSAPYRQQGRLVLHEQPSLAAAATVQDRSLDLVYIDAQHDYVNVKADIEAWLPKVKATGTISGHDYDDHFPEVRKAVDEIFGEHVNVVEGTPVWWVDVAAFRRSKAGKNGRKECQTSP